MNHMETAYPEDAVERPDIGAPKPKRPNTKTYFDFNGPDALEIGEEIELRRRHMNRSTDEVIAAFLAKHPNARASMETVRGGVPLIVDETRRKLDETVGHTGVAYPTFDHPYDDIPSGYAFHAVNSDVQMPHKPLPADWHSSLQ